MLSLAALGVVYGDIGTSPLYAIRESFHEGYGLEVVPGNVLPAPEPGRRAGLPGGVVARWS